MKPFFRFDIGIWDAASSQYRRLCRVSADTESHALDAVESLYGWDVSKNCSVRGHDLEGNPGPMFLPTGTLKRALVFAERIAESRGDADEAFIDAYPDANTVVKCNELMAIYDGTPLYGAFRFIRQYLEAIGAYRDQDAVIKTVDINDAAWYDTQQMTLPLS